MTGLAARVAAMEAMLGRGDWAGAREYLVEDVRYAVGARDPVTGIDGIRDYLEAQAKIVRWTGHEVALVTEAEKGNTVIIEVTSLFERVADAAKLRLPCTDIYRFEDGRIRDWRVYADLAAIGL